MPSIIATPAEATFILPATVSFDAAAALANYQVAYHIFNDALALGKGQTVLIYAAAGGMGNALIDLAKAAELKVIGVVIERGQGAIRPRTRRRSHRQPQAQRKSASGCAELTDGRGVDAIIDPVAGKGLRDNIAMLGPCGTLLVYGALGGKT